MIVVEGKVRIKVDKDVFYNPRMTFCRHLDVLAYKVIRDSENRRVTSLDALAATGVRGIRAKVEAGFESSFNDKSRRAVEVIRENLKLNGIEADVYNRDAVSLMRESRFTHVDLDPFGSPAEFIDSACLSALKYLSVTATDTAALCGSAPVAGLRKYGIYAEKTEFYPELGLRTLIGKIVREATKYDKAPRVLVSWAREHYYRVHVAFRRSVAMAGRIYEKMGYLFYCFKCGNRVWVKMDGDCRESCSCGGRFKMIGPLWLGELHDREFVSKMMEKVDELEVGEEERERIRKFLKSIRDEMDVPFSYSTHFFARILKRSPPKVERVIEELRKRGFEASRVHYSGVGFKTNAGFEEVKNVMLALNSEY